MAEREDLLLGDEFAAYRARVLPTVHPAGPGLVRETVRRRRRRSATAAAAVAVCTLAVPVAGWAAVGRHPVAPPAPVGTLPPEPTPTGTPEASATPAPSVSATGAQARISRADLLAATVDLPDWPAGAPCASGPTRLIDPKGRPGDAILSGFVGGYGDVDSDGVAEPVALIRCLVTEGAYPEQVVAFDRDAAGRVVVLGQVFRSDATKPESLFSLSVHPDGLVRVEVTDVVRTDASVPDETHRQWRGYRWNGTRFAQTDGPSSFTPPAGTGGTGPAPTTSPPAPPAPRLFEILGSTLDYGAPDGTGTRHGSTTITIANTGGGTVEHPMVSYVDNGTDQVAETEAQGCWNFFRDDGRITCIAQPLEPGGQAEVELPFTTVAAGPDHELTVVVQAGRSETGTAVPDTATTVNVSVSFGG
ncbi:hypothetical protein ACFO0M_08740 [Micromonospora mangrovi]|uniref:DUF4232 domain-containing protein n=2 Tax=Micromonospora TaxID=1873 RepID=A0AAU8HCY5_9ACTN